MLAGCGTLTMTAMLFHDHAWLSQHQQLQRPLQHEIPAVHTCVRAAGSAKLEGSPEVEVVGMQCNAIQEPRVCNGLHMPVGTWNTLLVVGQHASSLRPVSTATGADSYPVYRQPWLHFVPATEAPCKPRLAPTCCKGTSASSTLQRVTMLECLGRCELNA